jgi:hypothetical protein
VPATIPTCSSTTSLHTVLVLSTNIRLSISEKWDRPGTRCRYRGSIAQPVQVLINVNCEPEEYGFASLLGPRLTWCLIVQIHIEKPGSGQERKAGTTISLPALSGSQCI